MTDFILMPKQLTAENGAKAALIGKFSEEVELTCSACDFHGADENCEVCGGVVEYKEKITVSWDTIKQIYAKSVDAAGKAGLMENMK